jgi:hypothetical protein
MGLLNAKKHILGVLQASLLLCLVHTGGFVATNKPAVGTKTKKMSCPISGTPCPKPAKTLCPPKHLGKKKRARVFPNPISTNRSLFAQYDQDKKKRTFPDLSGQSSKLDLQGFPPSALLVVGTESQNFMTGMFKGRNTGTDLFGIRNGMVSNAAFSLATMDREIIG